MKFSNLIIAVGNQFDSYDLHDKMRNNFTNSALHLDVRSGNSVTTTKFSFMTDHQVYVDDIEMIAGLFPKLRIAFSWEYVDFPAGGAANYFNGKTLSVIEGTCDAVGSWHALIDQPG